ncbi:MAG: hypothetical protein ABIA37_00620 [Candidatus Woesearchaeota archaeon]
MAERISIKLNRRLFNPLLDELKEFLGKGFFDNDNDLVSKCVFFSHWLIANQDKNKFVVTNLQTLLRLGGMEKKEALITFNERYKQFKRNKIDSRETQSDPNI